MHIPFSAYDLHILIVLRNTVNANYLAMDGGEGCSHNAFFEIRYRIWGLQFVRTKEPFSSMCVEN